MTLDDLLRSAAQDVAAEAPDTYLAPAGIRAQARTTRRRQRVGVTAGLAVASAVAAIALGVGGSSDDALDPVEPVPSPSPTPSASPTAGTSTAPGVPVVQVPEIGPEDLTEYEVLSTVTTDQPGNEGLTDLTFEVDVRDRFTFEWTAFCSGEPDTWYVIVVGDGGASGSGFCDSPASDPFPALPTDIAPIGHSGTAAATQQVRMFLVDEIPARYQRCFDRTSPPECLESLGPLEPLASTDAVFGVSVYEYWAPSVAEVLGQELAARASISGTDYLLRQVLTPGAGQHGFTTTLSAADGDRLVSVLERGTEAQADCERAAGADLAAVRACRPVLELRIGDRVVPLVRDEGGDLTDTLVWIPAHGFFRVPPGDQEVEVRVASGDPEYVDAALVVFDEDP